VKKLAGANQQQINAEVSGQDSNLAQKSITGKILGESVNVETIAERRYLWTARAFSVIAAVSFCCNIALIMAIFQLVPLTRIEPFMISFADKSEQVVSIIPLGGNDTVKKEITETFVRQYVLVRSTFVADIPEMKLRWLDGSPIQEMSTQSVYREFVDGTANRAMEIIATEGLTREVRVLSVNQLNRDLWQVEYETKDMKPDATEPVIDYWTASLRVGYRKKTVKYEDRMKNPLGFTVAQYALAHNMSSSR